MDVFWTVGVVAVVLPSLYVYTASVVNTRFPALRNKRICVLIAHPDDEAMFFSPTVMALARPDTGNHVKILCLSSGNADGLGETRKKELAKSGTILGLRRPEDVFVVDKPEFPDSMTAKWDSAQISALLRSAFAPPTPRARSNSNASNASGVSGVSIRSGTRGGGGGGNNSDEAPTASIDVLITFDAAGVSGHPNHISLYHGAKAFVASLVAGKPGWQSPVDLYTLTTIPLIRKYTGFLDVLTTLTSWAIGADKKDKKHPGGLVFLSGLAGQGSVTTAWKAMISAHKSQMVWFRYGWITLSRYMYINDLRLVKVKKGRA
ncbi:putative deacetylase LmbE-like domain-containing protein [Dichotomopilus funicola]|uniref:N-acetylglucosaminylphosphatidylinositol deacetylase n=1 Tax=Dichotomopilus funicola TaxID=1934379 RepID=A0AAN6UY98_9PEZI|nr:putative deacetylase LmbE-like domain-containing protein [Dichotomopilus funicola]